MMKKTGNKMELSKLIVHMDSFTLLRDSIIPWINDLVDLITENDKKIKELETIIKDLRGK